MPNVTREIILILVPVLFAILQLDCWRATSISLAFPDEETLVNVFRQASLCFVPGFIDVISASEPPSIAWFESLDPTVPFKRWAIYCVVLRKQG
jgi:hypothetical protein